MTRLDIAGMLRVAGIDRVNEFSTAHEIGAAVVALAEQVKRLDALGREVVCREATECMKGNRIRGARRLVTAACKGVATPGHASLQGSAISFDEPEPWPDTVLATVLLDDLADTMRAHVFMSAEAADATALWILHTHALDAARHTPRLAFLSPAKRCGKTTALQILSALAARPLPTDNVSPAALFRVVEAHQPTLLVDEADAFARGNDELRGVLNSGHTRGGRVLRCVGDDNEPRAFRVFAPVAIAAIGTLWDTLLDRSIVITMRRAAPGEAIRKLRERDRHALLPLRRRCARWAADHMRVLKDAAPDIPDALHARAADNWEPLLAIADAAGGEWPARARAAALALSGGTVVEDRDAEALGIQLLADVRDVLDGPLHGRDPVAMQEVVDALNAIEDRPWATIRHGQPLDTRGLGGKLRPFGIRAVSVRAGKVTKGYHRADFADGFARYLPPAPVTPVTHAESQAIGAAGRGLQSTCVTSAETCERPSPSEHVTAVTDASGDPVDYAREERAAIIEHDGGLPRAVAEYLAQRDIGHA